MLATPVLLSLCSGCLSLQFGCHAFMVCEQQRRAVPAELQAALVPAVELCTLLAREPEGQALLVDWYHHGALLQLLDRSRRFPRPPHRPPG
jgi:hypothetical protein